VRSRKGHYSVNALYIIELVLWLQGLIDHIFHIHNYFYTVHYILLASVL